MSRWVHRSDVQGLRAVAVLLVVVHHAGLPVPGGFTGVDVFFVISGFVITGLLLEEHRRHGRVRLRRFYVRRVHRLLPALGLVTTVTAVLGMLLLSPLGVQQQTGTTGVATSFWLSNFALYRTTSDYFSQDVASNPLLHTWSLAVEEQFYLIFPLLIVVALWLATRLRRPARRTVTGVVVAVLVASFALSILLTYGYVSGIGRPTALAFYASPTRAWEFCAGALLALAGAIRLPRVAASLLASVLAWLGVAAIVVGVSTVAGSDPYPGWPALYPVLGTAALIAAGSIGHRTMVGRALESRPMVRIGDLSYSWYLWHWPFIVFFARLWPDSWMATALSVVLSFGAAMLSYGFVEERFRIGAERTRPRPGLIVAAVAVPAALSLALVTGASALWWSPQLQPLKQLEAQPINHLQCLSDVPVAQRDLAPCTWGGERAGPPIYLVGDSNAQQYSEGLIRAGELLDRPVVVITRGSCLPIVAQTSGDEATGGACRRHVAGLLDWLEGQPRGTVVVAGSTEKVLDEVEGVRTSAAVAWTTANADKGPVLTAALAGFLDRVRASGNAAAVVEPTPHLPGARNGWWSPVDCQNWTLFADSTKCSPSFSRAELDRRDAMWMSAETAAAATAGAAVIPVRNDLCPQQVCAAYRDGQWVYRDGVHITPARSRLMAEVFVDHLRTVRPG